jgi:deoxyribodipyrimidine photolyase
VEPPAEYKRRLVAWQRGQTGYPLVDAGMRELYLTGWMPQSVRMVCASFLVEYLRVSWVDGERWFGEKTHCKIFCVAILYSKKRDQYTKTGSGQT